MASVNKRRKLSTGNYEAIAPAPVSVVATAPTDATKDQRRSLFVRSLPASITTERLTEHFSQSYPLKHATVVVDPQTKISKGFGFVTFADAEDAHAAAAQFHNSVLDGRTIKVEVAKSRHREVEDGGKSGPNTTGTELRAQREQEKVDWQAPRLIIRNLPWSIKEPEDLSLLFRSYGKVKHAVVPKRGPNAQYGFGIVVIRGKKNAEKAIAGVNGKEVDGRVLAVDWAVDKKTWQELQQGEAKPMIDTTGNSGLEDQTETPSSQLETVATGSDTEAADMESNVDDDVEMDEELDDMSELDLENDISAEDESEQKTQNNPTVFVRNLPFTTDDEILKEHFRTFGPIRYARVVYDPETERSRGTAFVCFFNEEDAKACVRNAPKHEATAAPSGGDKKRRGEALAHSVLQNEATDPSGQYTLEGRVLNITRALNKVDADRRAEEASVKRDERDKDKRRLYLISEGTMARGSKLYNQLGKAELDIRESSAKQRQKLIKTNPNLCLSLTRLSVRNLPRHVDSKELKALAREAVVGFAKDAKAGIRQPLSKEELSRGGEAMKEAEKLRRQKGVGIVKQAKIVFEGREGGKVKEGGGRSRGYGFIEYVSHRNALAGLRWLNGHMVKSQSGDGEKGKRLIVEFAIENAQVVQRRNEREKKVREEPRKPKRDEKKEVNKPWGLGKKRKAPEPDDEKANGQKNASAADPEEKNNLAKRNRIIAKKRQARKTRRG